MNRRIAMVGLAVVLALVGTFVVYTYVHNADQRAIDKTRAAEVLIAVKRVPAGTTWQQAKQGGFLALDKIPVSSAPTLALSSLQASVGIDEVAAADIPSGQIVLRPMFSTKSATTGVIAIPKGM